MANFKIISKENAEIEYTNPITDQPTKAKGWIYNIEAEGGTKPIIIQSLFELEEGYLQSIVDEAVEHQQEEKKPETHITA